jgi:hypothetical protein
MPIAMTCPQCELGFTRPPSQARQRFCCRACRCAFTATVRSRPLTAEEVRSLLTYDPLTGAFTWIATPGRGIPAGSKAGYLLDNGRVGITIRGRCYLAARLAWLYVHGEWPRDQIDHKNRIRTDDRIENLREATAFQNAQNRGKHITKKGGRPYKGVVPMGRRFAAYISGNKRNRYLGMFDTAEAAAEAYNDAAKATYGDFAA